MPYITLPQSPFYHQITLEEILNGTAPNAGLVRSNEGNTRTFYTDKMYRHSIKPEQFNEMLESLVRFKATYKDLYDVEDRHTLYNKFYIPKSTGGLREINAPLPPLMDALNVLKSILEDKFGATHLYHTNAFAYVKGRSTLDAVKRHQTNNSHWFLKTDLTDFFGSTTKPFLMRMLKEIYPFNILIAEGYESVLSDVLDLCFLDGGLPQGTPMSPMLTNIIMIPIDFTLTKGFRHEKFGQTFCYTRYADDMIISSFKEFKFTDVVAYINDTLSSFEAPYQIKDKKTRYGSRAGSNWNLGVMLNKDNQITIGHKNKKYFRAMVNNYILDTKHNKKWPVEDVQHFSGLMSYYKMVEPSYIDEVIKFNNDKHSVDLMALIKADLSI